MNATNMHIKNIVFDFGGVLVDWNPRHLYRNVFDDEKAMEDFLAHVCTDEWNAEQDRGRPLAEGTQLLQQQFPEHHDLIGMYYGQWETMLRSDIPGTVSLLHRLKKKYHLYGLTNWSAETIPLAFSRYPFFKEFEGIVVSGEEKLIKPDKEIFHVLMDRYKISPAESLFIDDNVKNIHTARQIGFHAIHFTTPEQLEHQLAALQIL
ncbi:MAG TPA: HAD family phosphatase [Chitinophagaceae bacterium]|nr:HAD family phosphatase [Chitinophagaceae bacterium]